MKNFGNLIASSFFSPAKSLSDCVLEEVACHFKTFYKCACLAIYLHLTNARNMVASLRESNDELDPSDVAFSILKKWQLEKRTKRSGSLKYLHGVLMNDLGLDKAAELLDTRSTKMTTEESGVCRYLFCERDSEYCFPRQRFFSEFWRRRYFGVFLLWLWRF